MRQRGFTLLELLVALAVGSILITGTLLTLEQVVFGTLRARSQTVALNDINFAAIRIKKDIAMAQTTGLIDEYPIPQSSMTLDWIDCTQLTSANQTSHSIMYTLLGTELRRTYDGTMSIVGRRITSIGFTQTGSVIKVDITATDPSKVQQRSKTVSFSMRMRPEF